MVKVGLGADRIIKQTIAMLMCVRRKSVNKLADGRKGRTLPRGFFKGTAPACGFDNVVYYCFSLRSSGLLLYFLGKINRLIIIGLKTNVECGKSCIFVLSIVNYEIADE